MVVSLYRNEWPSTKQIKTTSFISATTWFYTACSDSLNGIILGRSFCRACHNSYCFCMLSHISALVPNAAERRSAISYEIPEEPFIFLDRTEHITTRILTFTHA